MSETTAMVVPVGAAYHAAFELPSSPMPTTEQWFAHQARRYLELNLGVQADVDRLHDVLPASGVVLCVFRTFRHEQLAELMTHVVVNGQPGRISPDLRQLTDEPWVPDSPHIMTDVRDGRGRCNIAPKISHADITQEGRLGWTAVHLVLWSVYYGQDVLTHHFLDGVASRCGLGRVPDLCLSHGSPRLYAYWDDDSYPEWGAPCAGSVIVPGV